MRPQFAPRAAALWSSRYATARGWFQPHKSDLHPDFGCAASAYFHVSGNLSSAGNLQKISAKTSLGQKLFHSSFTSVLPSLVCILNLYKYIEEANYIRRKTVILFLKYSYNKYIMEKFPKLLPRTITMSIIICSCGACRDVRK